MTVDASADPGRDDGRSKRVRSSYVAEHARDFERAAFMVGRTEYTYAKSHRKVEKGREISMRKILKDEHPKVLQAKTDEWKKHLDHDMFTVRHDLTEAALKKEGKNV